MPKVKKEIFNIDPYDDCDKSIRILENSNSYGALCIDVDFDDVEHDKVEKKVKKMIDILNKHWNDPAEKN